MTLHLPKRRLRAAELLGASNPHILAVAHRGSWRQAPENSLAAIEDAITLGAEIAEVDVQATADGALLLLHDETLDRTTGMPGKLAAMTFDELRELRLIARDGATHANAVSPARTEQTLPTLAAALEAARGRILLNIDLKGLTRSIALAEKVFDLVIAAGMTDQVILKSDVEGDIDEFVRWVRCSRFHGRVAFMPILHSPPAAMPQQMARLAELGSPMYEVEFDDFATLHGLRKELARQGARLWVNTLDAVHNMALHDSRALEEPNAVWGELARTGLIGAIQTDALQALLGFLSKEGLR